MIRKKISDCGIFSVIYSVIPALFLFFGNPNNVAKMAQYNQKLKMYRCTGAYIKEYRRTEMKEIKERNAGTGRKNTPGQKENPTLNELMAINPDLVG